MCRAATLRPDIASYPVGLNGLVFKTDDAEALSAGAGGHAASPRCRRTSFHRPVDLPEGGRDDARFRTVRLDRAAAFDGRIYWCEHITPDHVWRPEWLVHPNGAAVHRPRADRGARPGPPGGDVPPDVR